MGCLQHHLLRSSALRTRSPSPACLFVPCAHSFPRVLSPCTFVCVLPFHVLSPACAFAPSSGSPCMCSLSRFLIILALSPTLTFPIVRAFSLLVLCHLRAPGMLLTPFACTWVCALWLPRMYSPISILILTSAMYSY
ncbi:hypothetical protein B0H21DRAFT_761080 [Amylocystis lapponica]|nr:hypothetical protein B0H21DRAFT_772903 [Amylocystis lapponica]KAH9917633.1 hypothetical protein B0H21DRAFT_769287 [Amylocystis lapponica]KAH9931388.1 hypothetical protein B0H21DRAFT_761080 [Amylocystis lapponica]